MPAKLSDKKREIAKAAICINPDISGPQLAKIVGISKSTAHYLRDEIIKDDIGVDNFEILREQKKAEFIVEAWEVVGKALKLANKRFSKALEDEEAIEQLIDAIQDHELTQAEKRTLVTRLNGLQMNNIRDIAVALGTIYDKQALASGEPTQITERKEPTPELVSELEKKVSQLKQLTG